MASRRTPKKPTPVVVQTICSICGEDWAQHHADETGEVSTLECVRLLKAQLAARPTITIGPIQPWVAPYVPYNPLTHPTVTWSSSGLTINASNSATPIVATASAA